MVRERRALRARRWAQELRPHRKRESPRRGPAHRARVRLYERLRLFRNLYGRKFQLLDPSLTGHRDPTPFPREFGRRYLTTSGVDTVTEGRLIPRSAVVQPPGTFAPFWTRFGSFKSKACQASDMGSGDLNIAELDDMYWIVSERDMPMLKEYALTQLQYNRFEYWATGKVTSGDKIPNAPLFKVLFEGTDIGAFLASDHTREEYLQELARKLPRYFPAFLDMGNMDRMLGGSFLPGIEVGREAGKARELDLAPRRHQVLSRRPTPPDKGHRPSPSRDTHQRPRDPLVQRLHQLRRKLLAHVAPPDRLRVSRFRLPVARRGSSRPQRGGPRIVLRKLGFIRRQSGTFIEDEPVFQRP